MQSILTAISLVLGLVTAANAGISAKFDEGAPKDRFTLINSSKCALKNASVTFDLSSSNAGLIFDVTASGAGVEVYQPLEFVTGEDKLTAIPKVYDGDNQLTLNISELPVGESIAFTIDVDDTLGGQEIIVTDPEITGAQIQLDESGKKVSALFEANAVAKLDEFQCANS
ncbi:MAG: aggregation factor core [Rhizobiaceae bacterium]|nr:aggregation factor core [Rhizobiaceae bacterium]